MGRGTTDGVKKSVKRIRDAPNLHYRFYPEYARAPLASLSAFSFRLIPRTLLFFFFFPNSSLSLSLLVSLDQKPQVWKMKRLLLRPIPALFLSLIENRSILSPPCAAFFRWIENYSDGRVIFCFNIKNHIFLLNDAMPIINYQYVIHHLYAYLFLYTFL